MLRGVSSVPLAAVSFFQHWKSVEPCLVYCKMTRLAVKFEANGGIWGLSIWTWSNLPIFIHITEFLLPLITLMSTFGIRNPLLPLLICFPCLRCVGDPHLARPFPARHTIFGITPFCQAASQWHELSPLTSQHPLLSAAQSWSICPPSHWSYSQTTLGKGRRGWRDVRQPVKQPSSQVASQTRLFFLYSVVKPICWRQH